MGARFPDKSFEANKYLSIPYHVLCYVKLNLRLDYSNRTCPSQIENDFQSQNTFQVL